MSLMTSFVQIWLRPRMFRLDDVVSISLAIVLSASGSLMDDELSLARFELIVVVELLATDELLELGRRAQAVSEPAFFSIRTTPDIMFSQADHPTRPVTTTSGPSIMPRPKYPRLPSNRTRHRVRMPTPMECLAPGLRTVTSVTPCS